MIEIKAGPELDQAIAAVAFNTYYDRRRVDDCPRYSTDLNAAFSAAEAVGLFSETFWRTLGMDEFGETWGVFEQDGHIKRAITSEHHATPALALCEAILWLKGEGKSDV